MLTRELAQALGVDSAFYSRIDTVDPDLSMAVFSCRVPREPQHGDVSGSAVARKASQTKNTRGIDDGTAITDVLQLFP